MLTSALSDPDGSVPLIRRLFAEVFRAHLRSYLLVVACMVATAVVTSCIALLMRQVINGVFVEEQPQLIVPLSLAMIGLSFAKGLAAYGQAIGLGRIGSGIIASIQRRVCDKLLALDVDFFGRRHSAQLVTPISHNAGAARDVITLISTNLGRDLLTLIGLCAVMIHVNPLMSLIALTIAPIILFGMLGLKKRIRDLATQEYRSVAGVAGAAQETIQGIKVVKSFTLEQQMRERMDDAVAQAEQRSNELTRLQAARMPLMEGLGGVVVGLVITYAGWRTLAGTQTTGDLMSFITAFLLAYEPAKRLTRMNLQLQASLAGVRSMYELLDLPNEQMERPGAISIGRAAGRIAFHDVTFGYATDRPVLHGITLEAEPGSVIALVGPSGAGKTTIVNLIQRFYEPWSGTITLDGVDIATIELKSLRRQLSFVSQDTYLFSGTARENIALGSPKATEADIVSAIDAANASAFIADLPEGLDTKLGENGVTLSGGQRQRIAIARAVLKNAPVLILDEATSALDTQAERQVQSALHELMEGRTTIVIAHRLSTITRANLTYVVDAGRVVESGAHDSLLARNRLYARLFGTRTETAAGTRDDLAREWEIAS